MEAKRDENRIPTMLATLNTDGETTIAVKVNVSNSNSLMADDNGSGSDNGPANSKRDGNYVTTMMAVSESDGTTPVALYANSDGELLLDSS